jgi:hypothetical protein
MQREWQVQAKENNERKEQKMEKNTAGQDKADDWKMDLDSKLSFTETDSRRERIAYDTALTYCGSDGIRRMINVGMIDLPVHIREKNRDRLRAKENLTQEEVFELGEFPGALSDRNTLDLEELYGENLPFEPRNMIRLHLELLADFTDHEKRSCTSTEEWREIPSAGISWYRMSSHFMPYTM